MFFPFGELSDVPPVRPALRLWPVLGAAVGTAVGLTLKTWLGPLALLGALLWWLLGRRQTAADQRAWEAAQSVVSAISIRSDGGHPTLCLDEGHTSTPLLDLHSPFGLTLLASPGREQLVLAITHRDGVLYLGGRAPTGRRHREVLGRSITTPHADLPDTEPRQAFHDGDRLLTLADSLARLQPGAFDRLYLSDAGMADVVLDGCRLRAGQLDFELSHPLRFRGFTFQERSTFGSHGFQATWVRQGEHEITLVSLSVDGELSLPSLGVFRTGSLDIAQETLGPLRLEEVQRALARDLRLAQNLPELPPPRAQRVAIDRIFMPRLRRALDEAPQELAAELLDLQRLSESRVAEGARPTPTDALSERERP